MKILFFGDVYGRIGRKALLKNIENLKRKYSSDIVIANIDNISSGRGAIGQHVELMLDAGFDLLTGGDHIFDNITKIDPKWYKDSDKLLLPANISGSDWKEYSVIEKNNEILITIHVMGQAFMGIKAENPFLKVQDIIDEVKNKYHKPIIFIDMHAEATAETYGLAYHFKDDVHAVIGTHTHIQTNDLHVLENGPLLMADAGMCGPSKSVIGADFRSVQKRFLTGIHKGKIEQSLDKNYTLQGVYFEIKDGVIKDYETIQLTGTL